MQNLNETVLKSEESCILLSLNIKFALAKKELLRRFEILRMGGMDRSEGGIGVLVIR